MGKRVSFDESYQMALAGFGAPEALKPKKESKPRKKSFHELKKEETIAILEHALAESRQKRQWDFMSPLKALGYEHTYESTSIGKEVWEPAELKADNKRLGGKGILSSRFFTLYELKLPTHSWLAFVMGRIGNTSTYKLDTSKR